MVETDSTLVLNIIYIMLILWNIILTILFIVIWQEVKYLGNVYTQSSLETFVKETQRVITSDNETSPEYLEEQKDETRIYELKVDGDELYRILHQ